MRPFLAAALLVGLSVAIAVADDKPAPPPKSSTVPPEKDSRLAKRPGARTQKIGVLTYYANAGGGYTFSEGEHIAFYALPYWPTKSLEFILAYRKDMDAMIASGRLKWRALSTIGPSKMQ